MGARWGRLRFPEGVRVSRLERYIEWMSGGRRTGRVAYVLGKRNLPKPVAKAEWQIDSKFNVAEELLRDPFLEDVIKAAIDKGVEVVVWK